MSLFEELGWRQGSVLPEEMTRSLVEHGAKEGDLAVVISQDCDVTNSCLETEPTFEVILARRAEENGEYFFGKNPRRIQFRVGETVYEASIHDRIVLSREALLALKPSSTLLEPRTKRVLATWLGRRYDREAFPTALNNRLAQRSKQIRKTLKQCRHISGLYVQTSFEELPPGTPYALKVYATIPTEIDSIDNRQAMVDALDRLCREISQCQGVEVEDQELRGEDELSIDDLRFMKRWDFGYLSEGANPPDPSAPRG
jgi:hypothetical protein